MAEAKKVKKFAKVTFVGEHTYVNGVVSINYKLRSTHPRCIDKNAVSDVAIELQLMPDDEYQIFDDNQMALVAESDYYDARKVRNGHFRLSVPGSQALPVYIHGSYAGTYSFLRWWQGWIGELGFFYSSSWDQVVGSKLDSEGRFTKRKRDRMIGPPSKVRWTKNGVTHVVVCGRVIGLSG